MLCFLPNSSPSPYVAATDWHSGFQAHGESQMFQLEFMLSNVQESLPIISNYSGGGQEGRISEKSKYAILRNRNTIAVIVAQQINPQVVTLPSHIEVLNQVMAALLHILLRAHVPGKPQAGGTSVCVTVTLKGVQK